MMNHSNEGLRVLVVGGVACGPKTASRIKRLMPKAEVTMVEKEGVVSYGACGLPYFVEGLFSDVAMLSQTPVGVTRDPVFFESVKRFRTLVRCQAVKIDRDTKKVRVRFLESGREEDLSYDKLVLAMGARPVKPPLPGIDLENVTCMRHLEEASKLVDAVERQGLKKAVLIGAGYIGMEMAEALCKRGLEVTVVEMLDQVLPQFLDRDMALLVEKHLAEKGVKVLLGQRVLALDGDQGRVRAVRTDRETLAADVVVVAVGVRPNDELAREAGLACSPKGGIIVNGYCQTSDTDIYSGGDCVVNPYIHPITGAPIYVPLGSVSNKHGRVIANHIAGLLSPFPGVTGTGVCKIFDYTVGRTGITEKLAEQLNLDIEAGVWAGNDIPHYMPQSGPMVIKLVASRRYRKLLGAQVLAVGDGAKRLDVAASAIFFDATLDQIGYIDLGYAPPFSTPIDPIATAAHVLLNKMNGIAHGILPLEARRRMDSDKDLVLLDVRTPKEYQEMHLEDERLVHIPLGQLEKRVGELPRDRDILSFCKIGLRGYEAQCILNAAGFDRVRFVEGGFLALPPKGSGGLTG